MKGKTRRRDGTEAVVIILTTAMPSRKKRRRKEATFSQTGFWDVLASAYGLLPSLTIPSRLTRDLLGLHRGETLASIAFGGKFADVRRNCLSSTMFCDDGASFASS